METVGSLWVWVDDVVRETRLYMKKNDHKSSYGIGVGQNVTTVSAQKQQKQFSATVPGEQFRQTWCKTIDNV